MLVFKEWKWNRGDCRTPVRFVKLPCIVWYCMVQRGNSWYWMVLHDAAWYCIVRRGIALAELLERLNCSNLKKLPVLPLV